jgi:hypothetical protein
MMETNYREDGMTPIEKLGAAITDAGITWTDEMRAAWDEAKDQEDVDQIVNGFSLNYCQELMAVKVAAREFFAWFNKAYPEPSNHPDHEWSRLGLLLHSDTPRIPKTEGMHHKFEVSRVDGTDMPGCKHHGCRYFVLDLDHDEGAAAAMRAYAEAVKDTRPTLSAEILAEFGAPASPGSEG